VLAEIIEAEESTKQSTPRKGDQAELHCEYSFVMLDGTSLMDRLMETLYIYCTMRMVIVIVIGESPSSIAVVFLFVDIVK